MDPVQFRPRRDKDANISKEFVPRLGEFTFNQTTNVLKIGNGIDSMSVLQSYKITDPLVIDLFGGDRGAK